MFQILVKFVPQTVPETVSDGRHAQHDVEVLLDVLQEDAVQVGERPLAADVTTGRHLAVKVMLLNHYVKLGGILINFAGLRVVFYANGT